jgi:ribosomal protein S27AE
MIFSLILPTWTIGTNGEFIDFFPLGFYVSSGAEREGEGFHFISELRNDEQFSDLALALLSLLLLTLASIFLIIQSYRDTKSELISTQPDKYYTTIFITALITLSSPLFFMLIWPRAFSLTVEENVHFWGEEYDPNIGWYFQIISFFLIVAILVFIFIENKNMIVKNSKSHPEASTIPSDEQPLNKNIEKKQWFCQRCGTLNLAENNYCGKCGNSYRD